MSKEELESLINDYGDAMYSLSCMYDRGSRENVEEARTDLRELERKFSEIGLTVKSKWSD